MKSEEKNSLFLMKRKYCKTYSNYTNVKGYASVIYVLFSIFFSFHSLGLAVALFLLIINDES